MENIPSEFQDWEVLPSNSCLDSGDSFHDIHSEPSIHPNHFSFDAQNPHLSEDCDDSKSADSGNPSWIDPGSDENPTRYLYKESGEFWSDSSSAQSDDLRISEDVGKHGSCLPEKLAGSEGIGGVDDKKVEKTESFDKFCSESARTEESSEKFDEGNEAEASAEGVSVVNENENKRTGEVRKSGAVWWKMPIEFLRYCLFRMSPVWTVSLAAAVMGFVILGRRLYKMKTKAKGLEIKVAFDNKKASQVMSRAARLNEAFSVVKRVPVIRPSLPAAGVTTWPAMSLR